MIDQFKAICYTINSVVHLTKRGIYENYYGERVENFIRYRIGVINDFRGEFSSIEYLEWQKDVFKWAAFKVGSPPKYQEPSSHIHVFLNYQLVGKFKSNQEAQHCINQLLKKAPADFSEFSNYLQLPRTNNG